MINCSKSYWWWWELLQKSAPQLPFILQNCAIYQENACLIEKGIDQACDVVALCNLSQVKIRWIYQSHSDNNVTRGAKTLGKSKFLSNDLRFLSYNTVTFIDVDVAIHRHTFCWCSCEVLRLIKCHLINMGVGPGVLNLIG